MNGSTGSSHMASSGGAVTSGASSSGGLLGSASITGGSSSGTSGSSSGGTSSGRMLPPPYQGYDAGPRWEPPIDPGCTAANRIGENGDCVQCLVDGDCEPGLFCNPASAIVPFICVACVANSGTAQGGCPAGEVCGEFGAFPKCFPDCSTAGNGCPPFEYCEGDSGLCAEGCLLDADCRDAGIGLCAKRGPGPGYCLECIPNDAGCPGNGEFCDTGGRCFADCRVDDTPCPLGSHCDSATGLCDEPCMIDSDCGGSTPYCETDITPHACAQCRTTADCPAGDLGCGGDIFCSSCPKTCGYCASDPQCPSPLSCDYGCDCLTATSCQGFAITPACVGLDPQGGGSTYGVCGCNTTADCGPGLLCDPNQGWSWPGSTGRYIGGGRCVASCVGEAADYCANMTPYRPVCNPATGFCVRCVTDSDCAGDGGPPSTTPSCLPDDLDGDVALTGGGQCGCNSTEQCNSGLVCRAAPDPGSCVPPCVYDGGLDSCVPDGFCDTFNGFCRECLDDYDCTGERDPVAYAFLAPTCIAAGVCVQCTDASQCPADHPGCTFGACGYCATVADCPAGGGLVCAQMRDNENEKQCLYPCVQGDDAGQGSVSDAGPACPTALPFCVSSPADAGGSFCGECRGYASSDCAVGLCCGNVCSSANYECP